MGIRLRSHSNLNWLFHYFLIWLRIGVVSFRILYLIPHWASIEERMFLILEKNEEYTVDLTKNHSLFNQYLTFIFWTIIFMPTLAFLVLFVMYLLISLTCRPFWKFKREIRVAVQTLYRKLLRDFLQGYSRHYVLLDVIALESSGFVD